MKQTTMVLWAFACLALSHATLASAQAPTGAGFLNVNLGAQPQRRTLRTSESFTLYDEKATITGTLPIKNGVVFDLTGGYRVDQRLAIAVGVSSFRSSGDGGIIASIPDPAFFDRPKVVGRDTSGLERSELGVHLQAVWTTPVSDRVDVSVSAGPSLIRATQQFATGSIPVGTRNFDLTQRSESGTALGVNAGVDLAYLFSPQYGVGLFLRYAGGSVDLPTASSVKVGGFQGGLGLRLRF